MSSTQHTTHLRTSSPVARHVRAGAGSVFLVFALAFAACATSTGPAPNPAGTGTLAAARNGGIALFATDGSGYRQLVPEGTFPVAGPLVWNPAGTELLFNPDPGYIAGQRLYTVDLNGNIARVTQDDTLFDAEMWGQYSPDGSWIYFGGGRMDGGTIWRVHPDGTGLETAPGLPYVSGINNINPTLSPDGTRLAYVAFLGTGDNVIRVLDITTGTVNYLDVPGHTPRWAPNDDRIAYIVPTPATSRWGPIWVMHADGSQRHQISAPDRSYSFGINWSPDGDWIAASAADSGRIELINVTSGETVPVDSTSGFLSPAWEPGT